MDQVSRRCGLRCSYHTSFWSDGLLVAIQASWQWCKQTWRLVCLHRYLKSVKIIDPRRHVCLHQCIKRLAHYCYWSFSWFCLVSQNSFSNHQSYIPFHGNHNLRNSCRLSFSYKSCSLIVPWTKTKTASCSLYLCISACFGGEEAVKAGKVKIRGVLEDFSRRRTGRFGCWAELSRQSVYLYLVSSFLSISIIRSLLFR